MSDGSVSRVGAVAPRGANVTEWGSGPAISHVTCVPVATRMVDGKYSFTTMVGS
jgi:hypothetical protein